MKALVLNGSEAPETTADAAAEIVRDELRARGFGVAEFTLRDCRIAYCNECFGCWLKTPGVCVQDDDGPDVTRALAQCDVIAFVTPVTFGGYSWQLKKALDRSIGFISPWFEEVEGETHHKPRYRKRNTLVGVGTLSAPDDECERIFTTLIARNALNFRSRSHAAGVLIDGESAESRRGKVGALLTQAGVTK